MTYLDVWRSGTSLLYSCKAAFWIQETPPRLSDVECSVILRSVFAIGNALAYLLFFWECATPPHVQVRHTTWLSFTRPSPALVLQVTNAGVRRPGYEARVCRLLILNIRWKRSPFHWRALQTGRGIACYQELCTACFCLTIGRFWFGIKMMTGVVYSLQMLILWYWLQLMQKETWKTRPSIAWYVNWWTHCGTGVCHQASEEEYQTTWPDES